MQNLLDSLMAWLNSNPVLLTVFWSTLMLVSAVAANWLVKRILLRSLFKALRANQLSLRFANDPDVGTIVDRLAHVIPALIIANGTPLVPNLPEGLGLVLSNVSHAFIVVTLALAIGRGLTFTNRMYERRLDKTTAPIKGYIQIIRIGVYGLMTVLVVATLMDQSPVILMSGLGAMAAVLLFIFQHTLTSPVASVQLSSNDIVRLGDWIEMPELNANGEVLDIALHTVRVQNWDNTITSIPTKRFITDPFTNWRGMQESGGRRLMRSLKIDQDSVRFLAPADISHLQRFRLLKDHLDQTQSDINTWNSALAEQGREPLNQRRITNIGAFRAYVDQYLNHHPDIRQDMLHMARHWNPQPKGCRCKSMRLPARPNGRRMSRCRPTCLTTCWR